MNKNDVLKMLSVLQISYPNFYKGFSKQQLESTVNLYEEMFKEDDPKLVLSALKQVINTSEYPPTIATIKNKMYEMTHHNEIDNNDLWDSLVRAIQNSSYHSEEEFKKLPELVKEYIRSPRQLQEMASMESEVIHSVCKGQFMRQIEIIKQRKKEECINNTNLLIDKGILKIESLDD